MHNPNLIPVLLKDSSIPKGMIYRELKKALPCRIGIEFELAGDFQEGFLAEHPEYVGKSIGESLTNFYKVKEINPDIPSRNEGDEALNEIRVSIVDFHQLVGLYNFMQDLPKYCRIHEGGGIHIHVDMNEFNFLHTKKRGIVKGYITNRLNQIGKIFPRYKGKYNKKKVGDVAKATWVNMSRLGTLEFRTAPLTFDYYTSMGWLVKLIKFRRILIYECGLKTVKLPTNPAPSITNVPIGADEADLPCVEYRVNDDSIEIVSNDGTRLYSSPINTAASYTAYTTNGSITASSWGNS